MGYDAPSSPLTPVTHSLVPLVLLKHSWPGSALDLRESSEPPTGVDKNTDLSPQQTGSSRHWLQAGFYFKKQNPWTGLSLTRLNDKSRDSLASTLKIPRRESHGFPEPAISSLLVPTARCKEPHIKGSSRGESPSSQVREGSIPDPSKSPSHSKRAGCLRSGGRASLGAGPLTLHSMNCSMGEGRREEEENRDSELHSEIYGARPMGGGRTDSPASARGSSPS